jgi:hypothetical protein
VSKFDLSKYCIIYSKILICVIAFYSPSLLITMLPLLEIDRYICYVVKRLVTVIPIAIIKSTRFSLV